jgi:hypothetical protein
LNLLTALIIALFNVMLGMTIRRRTHIENKSHQTGYFSRVAQNLIIMYFINMVVIVLLANFLEYHFTAESIAPAIRGIPIDLPNMLNELFFMFITSTYISSICSIFDIMWGVRLFKRYTLKKELEKGTCLAT